MMQIMHLLVPMHLL